jgi:type IV pilus assembly protein PilZ
LQEKRSYPRVSIDLEVSCEVDGKPAFAGNGRDISLGGMFIDAAEVPAFGTKITVVARLPGINDASRLPAVVRWSSPGGFGVQFGLLGARETHAITRLMKG